MRDWYIRQSAFAQISIGVIGMLAAIIFVLAGVVALSTPDSGIGSDAYQQGQEDAAEVGNGGGGDFLDFGCTDANARDYLGGLPSRDEIDDWTSGCVVGE